MDTVEDTAGVFGKAVVDVGDPELVKWVRSLPLSLLMGKATVDLGQDFADGICLAEIVRYYKPHSVNIQAFYGPYNKGVRNWEILGAKHLGRWGVQLTDDDRQTIVTAGDGALPLVEQVLRAVYSALTDGGATPVRGSRKSVHGLLAITLHRRLADAAVASMLSQ